MTTIKKAAKAAKSVTLIIIFTIASRFLGFIREMLIANKFGASMETDAYFIATTASVLVIGIIGMALGTTLIPILSEIENEKGITKKNNYLNNIFK